MPEWKWPRGIHRHTPVRVAAVLWSLKELGGEVYDPKGCCKAIVLEHAASRGFDLPNIQFLFERMEAPDYFGHDGPCIRREMGSRQTYRVTLLVKDADMPPCPWPRGQAGAVSSNGSGPINTAAELRALLERDDEPVDDPASEPMPEEQSDDPVDDLLTIMRLSNNVLCRLASGMASGEEQQPNVGKGDQAERLAAALDENARLRRKLAAAEETARARKAEADAARRANVQLQSNLNALLNQSRHDDSGFKALRKMMAEKPRVASS